MSTERIIHLADLAFINSALRSLQTNVNSVSSQVDHVGQELHHTRSELSRLEQAFADFVEADVKAKAVSLAETRLVKIRQEIEKNFGPHAIVRRHATGILQASDIQLVRKETIRSATEELMLSTPRYWLAPALVALAGWLDDNRELSQRALAEAIRRDDEKTSLFFALICRRADRTQANRVWLDRYFGLQNPFSLDRQTVVMIDALSNGVFSVDTTQLCSKRIKSWIEELSDQAGFTEAQRSQWSDALQSKMPNFNMALQYPHLAKFSPTWDAMNTTMNEASMQTMVLTHFENVFGGEIKAASSVLVAVDDLLSKLVTRFDDEELPLLRQEEMCSLIIEENGDTRTAQKRYDLKHKALDEQIDFTQLLTNAAMHPENSHVTLATQRFAIAHSRDWILDAHSDVTAKARQRVPQTVDIQIEDWKGQTSKGENEEALLQSLEQHIDQRKRQALEQAKLGLKHWGGMTFGVILILMSTSYGMVSLLLGLAALGWVYLGYREVQKQRTKIHADFSRLQEQSAQALRACLAETVEWRRDWAQRDAVATQVTEMLESISPEQHLLSTHDNVRRVMQA